ncbi:MurR/RpiR family transcriptional regulator [Desnuesiella massiliensis]|uniref:MurR/RpiR family transcriptional regulator n=1 Tax=Desnuesiella massiliensis TaxID=1650662 RepID=UPI0006E2098E|nr:MurR/RpiR family transcriptional regulator [Desnuesiella massiliensis]
MDVLGEIQKKYTGFSEKERNIADYILKNTDSIKNINISDLAERVSVSGATITRFCKKIGCNSFVDMKIQISGAYNKIDKNKDEGILSDVYYFYKNVIERTNRLIDKDMIFKLVKDIKKARRIYIYGVGSSGLTASEMMLRLIRMGFDVHSITDSHMMIINSAIVTEEDLVIGISISGETAEVIQSLRVAKENGAKVVSITSFEESSVAHYSDMTLIVYNSGFVDKERFVNSQFSAIYLIDLISTVLLKNNELKKKMQITINAIIGREEKNKD